MTEAAIEWWRTPGQRSLARSALLEGEPQHLQYLAMAYAELGQLDDVWRCIGDAIETIERSKEKWGEAEVHRIAGETALKSPDPDAAKAEAYFDRACGRTSTASQILGVARGNERGAAPARSRQAS